MMPESVAAARHRIEAYVDGLLSGHDNDYFAAINGGKLATLLDALVAAAWQEAAAHLAPDRTSP